VSTKLLAALFIPAALWSQAPSPFEQDQSQRDEGLGKSAVSRGVKDDLPLMDGSGSLVIPELSSHDPAGPISGVVSVQQLRHPAPKKAMQAMREAVRYEQEHNTTKTIEKLELAVRIDPLFREAQTNLGAQYVHAGRLDEAVPHFQKAYEAGPPDPITCANLAWAYTHLREWREAEAMARKALELSPGNPKAEKILKYASAH